MNFRSQARLKFWHDHDEWPLKDVAFQPDQSAYEHEVVKVHRLNRAASFEALV